MDSKERVIRAIERRPADRVPRGEIFIDGAVVQSVLGCPVAGFEQRREFVQLFGLDAVCLAPAYPAGASGRLPPPAGVIWPDLDKWAGRTDRFIFVILDGAVAWGSRLLGFDRLFSGLTLNSPEITGLIGAVEEFNLELARMSVSEGASGILVADDIAYRGGLMIGPPVLKRFIFPSLSRQAAAVHSMKAPVFFHSDGNIGQVLGEIVEAGFDGLQCIESAAGMDIGRVKRDYGSRLCLWGNLDPDHLLLPRDPRELREAVETIVAAASPGGGFIFGSSSGLFPGVRVENLRQVYRPVT